MMMNGFEWDSKGNAYRKRHKLSNGQYCEVRFYKNGSDYETIYYVAFAVANKKKNLSGWFAETRDNNITLKSTGRCGLEALVWCYHAITEFEQGLSEQVSASNWKIKLAIIGEDHRRFQMYEKALSKKGYCKVFLYGEWTMIKTVKYASVQ